MPESHAELISRRADAMALKLTGLMEAATRAEKEDALHNLVADLTTDLHALVQDLVVIRQAALAIREEQQDFSDQLGEAIHTAFRKGSDHPAAWEAWKAMNRMPEGEWAVLLDWIRDATGLPGRSDA